MVWQSHVTFDRSRSQYSLPELLGSVTELLHALSLTEETIKGISGIAGDNIRRRKGFMLSVFAALHGRSALSTSEVSDLIDYEASVQELNT